MRPIWWTVLACACLAYGVDAMAQAAGQATPPPLQGHGVAARLSQAADAYKRKDYAAALTLARSVAEDGNPVGQSMLGHMYHQGQGVAADPVQAEVWYRKAALQGNPNGLIGLGFLYQDGAGVRADKVEAYRWLSLGAATLTLGNEFRRQADGFVATLAATMTPQEIDQAKALIRDRKLPVVVQPDWIARPSEEDLSASYPEAAVAYKNIKRGGRVLVQKTTFGGRAMVACDLAYRGRTRSPTDPSPVATVENCEVLSEDPVGKGFGAAAAKVIQEKALFSPKTIDGVPSGGNIVRVPVTFKPKRYLLPAKP